MHQEHSVPKLSPMPAPGFYYHYKHDPDGKWNGYAYEVLGTGHNTEECPPEEQFKVVYRPLYEWALVYRLGKLFDLRPLAMFMEAVNKADYQGPRFRRIEDPELIERLIEQRKKMYGA